MDHVVKEGWNQPSPNSPSQNLAPMAPQLPAASTHRHQHTLVNTPAAMPSAQCSGFQPPAPQPQGVYSGFNTQPLATQHNDFQARPQPPFEAPFEAPVLDHGEDEWGFEAIEQFGKQMATVLTAENSSGVGIGNMD
mmetsp:Transcript_14567/g.22620  ORF Transcript_14567/g.22620 Transcript_14567/m.22620 type:complete len:136 (+) Transcript_14567:306-713(+)